MATSGLSRSTAVGSGVRGKIATRSIDDVSAIHADVASARPASRGMPSPLRQLPLPASLGAL
eukprot:8790102-Alexandrium_andersonii.AAC.1